LLSLLLLFGVVVSLVMDDCNGTASTWVSHEMEDEPPSATLGIDGHLRGADALQEIHVRLGETQKGQILVIFDAALRANQWFLFTHPGGDFSHLWIRTMTIIPNEA
jgi:hypothetical protein